MIKGGDIVAWHPFEDEAHFRSWWTGQYDFARLRLARNRVVHARYSLSDVGLTVDDDSGIILLDWSEADMLRFARAVVKVAKRT